jgi:hypothetical protein
MKMKKIISSFALTVLTVHLIFAQGTGKDIPNMSSGGSIGTAANTVDKFSLFNIVQTTANQTITIPNPTVTTNYRMIEMRNKGSVSFTLVPGGVVDTSNYFTLTWVGTKWVFNNSGAVSSGGGSGPPLTQTVTNGDQTHATSGDAVYDFVQVVQSDIDAHEANTNNPHNVTKAQVGLPLVDNTSDASKPISTLQQAGLDLKVDKVGGKGLSTEDYSTSEKSKLAGIAPLATANSSDATLLARANHTGTQLISTVSGLQAALDAKLDASAHAASTLTGTLLASNVVTSSLTTVGTLTNLIVTNTITGSISGNSATATTLQTSRNIDGVAFNGSADITVIAPATHAATSKTTPVDADELPLVNSASSNVLAKLTWANLKATLLTYFNLSYQPINSQCNISSTVIDWNCTHSYKTGIAANTTFSFTNAANAKTIVFTLTNSSGTNTLGWPTVSWLTPSAPPQLSGTATVIITLTQINGIVYGSYVY